MSDFELPTPDMSAEQFDVAMARIMLRAFPAIFHFAYTFNRDEYGIKTRLEVLKLCRIALTSVLVIRGRSQIDRTVLSSACNSMAEIDSWVNFENVAVQTILMCGREARTELPRSFLLLGNNSVIQVAGSKHYGLTEPTNKDVRAPMYDDADKILEIDSFNDVLNDPLWPMGATSEFNIMAITWIGFASEEEPEWSFWREWYQGFLDGKPLDWELQKEIALIPDADWDKGSAWIAGLIENIRKRREVEAAITAVKDEISGHRATIAHRTHNQPPEVVDEVSEQLTIIWDHLSEIEAEIAEENPAIEKLRQLLLRTLAYAKAIGLYVVSLGDAALKKAAEEIGSTGGKWVVRAGVAYFAAQTPSVQSGLQKVGTLLSELIKLLQ